MSLIKSVFSVSLGKIISLLLTAVTFIFLARLLGATTYGIYVIILASAGLLSTAVDFSLDTYLSAHIPMASIEEKRKAIGDTLVLISIAGVLMMVVGLAINGYLSTYILHSTNYYIDFTVGLLAMVLFIIYTIFNNALISLNFNRLLVKASLVNSVAEAVLIIGLVLLGYGIFGALTGYMLGYAFGLIYEIISLYLVTGITINFDGITARWKKILTFSLPISVYSMLQNLVTNFAVIFLGIFVVTSIVGNYGVALRLGVIIDVPIASLALVLLPRFSNENKENNNNILYQSIYLTMALLSPLVISSILILPYVVPFVLTNAYLPAVSLIWLQALGLLIGFSNSYCLQLLTAMHETKRIMKYGFICVAIQFTALLLLVPHLGAIGAIIGITIIPNILLDILYFRYIMKNTDFKFKKLPILVVATFILLICVYITYQSNISMWIKIGIGLVLLLLWYPLLRISNLLDKEQMKVIFKPLRRIGITYDR